MNAAAPAPPPPATRRAWTALALLLPLAVGGLLAASHIADPVWYDEAYTLEHFATGTVAHAFTRYDAPNNHVLFSALLSLWKTWIVPGTPEVPLYLRPLPILLYAASVLLLTSTAWRMGGRRAAVLSGLLFATSHVVLNYSAQLRGYGFSWLPVAGALLLARLDAKRPRWWTAPGFVLLGSAAVGIVPTNGLVVAVLAAWRVLLDVPGRIRWSAGYLARLAAFVLAPLPGLLVYAGVWTEFRGALRTHETHYTAHGNAAEWWHATMIDLWWLWPVLAGGLVLALLRAARGDGGGGAETPEGTERPEALAASGAGLRLLLVSAALPPLAWWILPNVPYPRTLVPLLPAWYLAWGGLAAGALDALARRSLPAARLATVLLVLALIGTATRRERSNAGYVERYPPGTKPFTLYDQYPRDPRFDPAGAARWLHEAAAVRPLLVLTDETDLWAVQHALGFHPVTERLRARYFKHELSPEAFRRMSAGRVVLLLTRTRSRARRIRRYHDLPGEVTKPVYDGGFFRVYGLTPAETGADGTGPGDGDAAGSGGGPGRPGDSDQ